MNDERDPILKALFAEAQHDLDDQAFTSLAMTRTRGREYRLLAYGISGVLIVAAGAWFFSIPLEFAQLLAQALSTTLVDLGNSWLAFLLSPVNNIASLLLLGGKAIRIVRKKILRGSYAY